MVFVSCRSSTPDDGSINGMSGVKEQRKWKCTGLLVEASNFVGRNRLRTFSNLSCLNIVIKFVTNGRNTIVWCEAVAMTNNFSPGTEAINESPKVVCPH